VLSDPDNGPVTTSSAMLGLSPALARAEIFQAVSAVLRILSTISSAAVAAAALRTFSAGNQTYQNGPRQRREHPRQSGRLF
jgi:hypothetical protein